MQTEEVKTALTASLPNDICKTQYLIIRIFNVQTQPGEIAERQATWKKNYTYLAV